MFTFLTFVAFFWLFGKGIGLAFRLTWGAAKLIGGVLMVLALPVLGLCALTVGGAVLLLPVAMVGMAVAILKACV